MREATEDCVIRGGEGVQVRRELVLRHRRRVWGRQGAGRRVWSKPCQQQKACSRGRFYIHVRSLSRCPSRPPHSPPLSLLLTAAAACSCCWAGAVQEGRDGAGGRQDNEGSAQGPAENARHLGCLVLEGRGLCGCVGVVCECERGCEIVKSDSMQRKWKKLMTTRWRGQPQGQSKAG